VKINFVIDEVVSSAHAGMGAGDFEGQIGESRRTGKKVDLPIQVGESSLGVGTVFFFFFFARARQRLIY